MLAPSEAGPQSEAGKTKIALEGRPLSRVRPRSFFSGVDGQYIRFCLIHLLGCLLVLLPLPPPHPPSLAASPPPSSTSPSTPGPPPPGPSTFPSTPGPPPSPSSAYFSPPRRRRRQPCSENWPADSWTRGGRRTPGLPDSLTSPATSPAEIE